MLVISLEFQELLIYGRIGVPLSSMHQVLASAHSQLHAPGTRRDYTNIRPLLLVVFVLE